MCEISFLPQNRLIKTINRKQRNMLIHSGYWRIFCKLKVHVYISVLNLINVFCASDFSATRQGNDELNLLQGTTGGSGRNIATTNPFHQDFRDDNDSSSLDLETMHLMLEPNMRPVTPDPSSRISLEIFNEHKSLAQEFLKVNSYF